MLKKVTVCAVFVLAVFCSVLGAVEPPKKYLSAADVQAFKTNFHQIEKDFEALDESYDTLFAAADGDTSVSLGSILETDIPSEVERILEKNGLKKPSFAKYMVISFSIMALYLEKGMEEQKALYASMPEVAASLDAAVAEIQTMKSEIHPSDLALVAKDLDALAALVSEN